MHERATIPVLVVGQTPPPITGQAEMIKHLVEGEYEQVDMHHVRMSFSHDTASIGRFQSHKLLHLWQIVSRVLRARYHHHCRILCYPPAGQSRNAVYRDIMILLLVRPFFLHTVFYFHAGGVSELVKRLPPLVRALARHAYRKPTCSIRTSALNPDDGAFFGSAMSDVVANAVPDAAASFTPRPPPAARSSPGRPRLLFMGILYESKGVLVLLEACAALAERGLDIDLVLAGAWGSDAFREQALAFVETNGLSERVHFAGVLRDEAKWQAFHDADIFCFPSHFESETFGLVVLEAMQFGLPVIATRWRGIPSLVDDEKTGILIPIRDSNALANAIQRLVADPVEAMEMGGQGREAFCRFHDLTAYRRAMERVFVTVDRQGRSAAPPAPANPARCMLGNTAATSHDIPQFLAETRRLLSDPGLQPRTLLCLNAHIYNVAERDPALRATLNAARVVAPDGISIVWAARVFGTRGRRRCNMTEAFRAFLTDPDVPDSSAVLIGCTEDEVAGAADHIAAHATHCHVTAALSGFMTDDEYRRRLAELDPADLVLVGAGTPRSEQLADLVTRVWPRVVVWHIGAGTIRMLAGTVREAPRWMRRAGIQWLHRLFLEPHRMWRRYVLGNPVFVWRILRARFAAVRRTDPDRAEQNGGR